MPVLDHTEAGFETLIVEHMISAGGWEQGDPTHYDRKLALYPDDLIAFVRDTQGKAWDKLVKHSAGEDAAAKALTQRVAEQLTKRGTIDLVRNGVSEKNIRFKLCYFRPNLVADHTGLTLYNANRLTVIRQIHHDAGRPQDSIDLVLFVNGIPTATAELKNKYSATGWDVEEAIRQYREDRDPRNVLLGERALVHFALDGDLAYMTTRLAGEGTRFLPFNQGSGGPGSVRRQGQPAHRLRAPSDGLRVGAGVGARHLAGAARRLRLRRRRSPGTQHRVSRATTSGTSSAPVPRTLGCTAPARAI